MMSEAGLQRLRTDEEYERFAYDDKTARRVRAPLGNLTIGYGTNLDVGITNDEAEFLMIMRVIDSEEKIIESYPPFVTWPAVQRDILTMIDYNTGNALAWTNLINSIASGAPIIRQANNVRDSLAWRSTLTRPRYERFAQAIIYGHW